MKVKQSDLTLLDIAQNADSLWLQLRWKEGKPQCPYCHKEHKQYLCRDGRYKCDCCNHRYSSRTGTAFHNSKLSIRQIMLCIYVILMHPAVSAMTLSRSVGITYNTGLGLLKRIQLATEQQQQLTGTVAVDEVYLGGRWRFIRYTRKLQILRRLGLIGEDVFHFTASEACQGIDQYKKPVFGGNDGDKIFLLHLPTGFDKECITDCFGHHTTDVQRFVSDDSALYGDWPIPHEVNNHSHHQYRSGNGYSSNSVEGTFSHYRTDFEYAHMHCESKYLQLYLNLFVFKWNNRKESFMGMLGNLLELISSRKCTSKDIRSYDGLAAYKAKAQQKEQERLAFARELLEGNYMIHSVEIDGRTYDHTSIGAK